MTTSISTSAFPDSRALRTDCTFRRKAHASNASARVPDLGLTHDGRTVGQGRFQADVGQGHRKNSADDVEYATRHLNGVKETTALLGQRWAGPLIPDELPARGVQLLSCPGIDGEDTSS